MQQTESCSDQTESINVFSKVFVDLKFAFDIPADRNDENTSQMCQNCVQGLETGKVI